MLLDTDYKGFGDLVKDTNTITLCSNTQKLLLPLLKLEEVAVIGKVIALRL